MKLNISFNIKLILAFLILFLFNIKKSKATHVEGGDITYQCLGGNQFKVKMALYRDCAGVAAPANVSLNFSSISCGLNFNSTLVKIPGTGIEVTPVCPGMPTLCSGGSLPGVQEYIYQGTVTLPPCSDWVMSYSIAARNNAIGTIVAPGAQNMYIEAKMDNLNFPCDNSPSFTNRPVPFICTGQPYCFNNGAIDPDGDQLIYSLITPRNSATTNVTYIAPYTALQPLTSVPAVTFDTATGDMCMTPTVLQITVFSILVKSYRGGVFVGSVERDIQLTTVMCSNNNPSLNGINNTGLYTMNACAGMPLSFNIPSFDPDAAQNVSLTWNAGITGANFNSGTGTRPTGIFSWTPSLADVSATPHCFTVNVKDNNCPFIGSQTYSFCITVGGFSSAATSTNAICTAHNGSASVNVIGGILPISYSWTPSGGNSSIASALAAGSYTCTITDANGCSKALPVNVNANTGGTASISSFSNVTCNGAGNGTATVSMSGPATAPFTYAWSPASAGSSVTAVNLIPGTYTVNVTDANGCVASATQLITQPPVLNVSPTFTNAGCFGGSTGTATASPTGGSAPYSYLWMPGAFNTASINNLSVGNYTVTVTDQKGCITTGTASITQPAALEITAIPTGANCGLSNGSATVSATGGFAPYTWSWSNGQTGPTATGLQSGTYTVTVSDLNLCTASIPVTIGSIAGPSAVITSVSNVSCFNGNNGNATINISGGTGPFVYLWTNGASTPTANNLTAGIYSATATDVHGCVASANVTITQPSDLIANAVSTDPVCFGSQNGTAAAGAVGGTPPYSYSWTLPGTPTTSTVSGLGAGTYNVTVTDSKGCVKNASITLTNPPTLNTSISTVNVTCNSACNGTATATVSNGTAPYSYSWNNSSAQTTSTANGLCAGNYTITVSDAHGCPSQGVASITQPSLLTNTISSTGNLTCYGVCTGFAQVTASGGTAPYSYSWMPGGYTSATASGLCAGSYTCTVTDAKGCTASAIATITQPPQLTASISGTNINCFGTCDGTGNINFSGGTPPYTFLWTPGMQTTFNPTNLCPGINTANVIDSKGCSVSGIVNLTQSYTPIVVTSSTTNSNCGQSNGGACASVSGGLPPYTYIWNDPNVTQAPCAVSLLAGTYNVDVTDANGCTITSAVNVNDVSAPTLAITSHTDLLCYGASNGAAVTSVSGGLAPYTFSWSPGGQSISNPVNLSAGINSISVTDAAGCVSSASVNIISPSAINHAINSLSNVSCYGMCNGSATIIAAGGTAPLTFAWSDPLSQTTSTANNLCPGNYNVVITDGNGCSVSDAATIIVQPGALAISSSSVSNITCFGDNNGSINTSVSGGTPFYLFSWNPSVSVTPVANGLSAGTYTLNVWDQNGCSTSQSWTISEPPMLTDTFSFAPATCGQYNGSATVSPIGGSSPYTFQWNDPSFQTSATCSGLAAGTYSAMITDANGCIRTENFVINDLQGPVIDNIFATSVLCYGGNTGAATAAISNGTSPYNYNWMPGSLSGASITQLSSGTYSLTVTDANGCVANSSVYINQPQMLEMFISANDTICYGDSCQIYITAANGSPAYNYFWLGSSGTGLSGTGPHLVMPVSSTTYSALALDNNGCSIGPLDVQVIVKPPLSVVASDTTICEGDTALIRAIPSGGNIDSYSCLWDNNAVTFSQQVAASGTAQSYTYVVTLSDGCSPSVTDTSTVYINPHSITQIQALPNTGCSPLTVHFSAVSNQSVTYNWNFGDGHTGTGNNPQNTFTGEGIYDVILNVLNSAGCSSVVDSLDYVRVYPEPIADFVADPDPASSISPLVSFTDHSTSNIATWSWNFGDPGTASDTSNLPNPQYLYTGVGMDSVKLIVTNQFGCKDTTLKQIEIEDDYVFYAPNAFTPDNDGLNDVFIPKIIGYELNSFNMMIFDRWGNSIYTTNDLDKGWNGKANNGKEIAQIDVYVWKVMVRDNRHKLHSYMGHVSIVK